MKPEQLKIIEQVSASAKILAEGVGLGVINIFVTPEGAFEFRHSGMNLTEAVGALHRSAHVLQTCREVEG